MESILEPECTYSKDLINEANILKNIGHPVRLKILTALYKQDCQVKIISKNLGLKQAVTSFQLLMLRRFGVVEGKRKGVEMHYRIVDPLAIRIVEILSKTLSGNSGI